MLPKTHNPGFLALGEWPICRGWDNQSKIMFSSSVYSCHLYLISSTSVVFTISVLYHAHPYMKFSIDTSNFCEEISSLSHSIVSLYFFALITEEGFLIAPCYSLELCIQMGISFLSPLLLLLFFSQLFIRSPQTAILSFCISFSWGWSWSLPPVQCHEPPSIVLQALYLSDLIPWIYLSLSLYNHKGI